MRRRLARVGIYLVPLIAGGIPTIPAQQPANYIQTTLAAGVTNIATDWPLTSVAGLPTTGNFMLRCDDAAPATTFEIVECTAVNVGTGHVTVVRGQENTGAIAHLAGAFVGNDITTGMLLRMFPWGTLAYAQVIATQGGFGVQTDITGVTVTFTAVAGRRYKVTVACMPNNTVAATLHSVILLEGATTLKVANVTPPGTNGFTTTIIAVLTPAAGAHTYKLAIQPFAGSCTNNASATDPSFILVEDIGPA